MAGQVARARGVGRPPPPREAAGEGGLERSDAAHERMEQEVTVVGRDGLRLLLLRRGYRRGVGVCVGFGLLLLVLVVVRVRVGIYRLMCGGRRLPLLLRLRGGGGRSLWSGSGGAEQELGDDGVEEMVGCGGAGRGWGWSRSRSQHGVIARGRDRRGVVARRRCVSAVAAVAAVAGRRGGVGAGVTAHFRVIWWGFSARGDRIAARETGGGVGARTGKEMRFGGADAAEPMCRPQ
jgi:hypothetical protein